MNRNLILKSDILDIVFENRNKAYGAYMLRKLYPGRLKLALGLMFILAAAFSAFTLLPETSTGVKGRVYIDRETILTEVDIQPAAPIKQPELPKTTAAVLTPVNQKIYTSNPMIVTDNVKTDVVNTILSTDVIGKENIINTNPGPFLIEPVKSETGNGMPEKPVVKINNTVPMDIDAVDVRPGYPGGMDALVRFLEKHLQNPYDQENGETISVQIKFVVGYDGKLKSFVTVKDGGDAYNKEVIRVLKKMPEWIPGKSRGENVSVYYTIPVKFVMSN